MKPENLSELKKLLVNQYSEINHIKSEKLIVRMKQTDWWEKEKYRINVQYTGACICFGFVIACVLIVSAIVFSNHNGSRTAIYSLISVLFSMLLVLSFYNNINQKKKLFKILELTREE